MDGNLLRLIFAWLASGTSAVGTYAILTGALDHYGCQSYDTFQDVCGILAGAAMFGACLGLFCRALDVIAHEQSDERIREFLRYRR